MAPVALPQHLAAHSLACWAQVMPRPGVKAKGEVQRTLPYISVKPEYMQMQVSDGFLVVACDGVWDEMSSDEAVKIIAKLLLANKGNPEANIADLFIEETLKKAVVRLQGALASTCM